MQECVLGLMALVLGHAVSSRGLGGGNQTVELPSDIPDTRNAIVLGRVIGVHIKDEVLTDGMVDMTKIKPIARLGYMDYTRVDTVFTMPRPAV